MRLCIRAACAALLPLGFALNVGRAAALEDPDWAPKLLARHMPAIVTVRVVTRTEYNISGQKQDQESRLELGGVVVSADGLVMISTALFSSEGSNRLLKMLGAGQIEMNMVPVDFSVVVGNEDREYACFLTANDSDLGLAFLQIEGLGGRRLTAVDFGTGIEPGLLQPVAAVQREKRGFDYAPYLTTARIAGATVKPRKAWFLDGALDGIGLPVFACDGSVVGVLTTLSPRAEEASEGGRGPGGIGMIVGLLGGGGRSAVGRLAVVPASAVQGLIGGAKKKASELARERAKAATTNSSDPVPPRGGGGDPEDSPEPSGR